jgi:hypothetical protein
MVGQKKTPHRLRRCGGRRCVAVTSLRRPTVGRNNAHHGVHIPRSRSRRQHRHAGCKAAGLGSYVCAHASFDTLSRPRDRRQTPNVSRVSGELEGGCEAPPSSRSVKLEGGCEAPALSVMERTGTASRIPSARPDVQAARLSCCILRYCLRGDGEIAAAWKPVGTPGPYH